MAVDQRVQRIRLVAGLERHVRPEPQNVEPIDPDVIRVLLSAGIALEARPGERIEIEALGAFLALLGTWSIEWPLAFAPVEAGEVPAVERQPGDAVAVDIHAADAVAGQRDLVDLRERGVRRVGA